MPARTIIFGTYEILKLQLKKLGVLEMVLGSAPLFTLKQDTARFLSSLSEDGTSFHCFFPNHIWPNPFLHYAGSVMALLQNSISPHVQNCGEDNTNHHITHRDLQICDLHDKVFFESIGMGDFALSGSELINRLERINISNENQHRSEFNAFHDLNFRSQLNLMRDVCALQIQLIDATFQ